MTGRRRAYRRVIASHLALGVTREQVAEVIARIGPTDPADLTIALGQYVPQERFHSYAGGLTTRQLLPTFLHPSQQSLSSVSPAASSGATGLTHARAARWDERHHIIPAEPSGTSHGGDAGSIPAARFAAAPTVTPRGRIGASAASLSPDVGEPPASGARGAPDKTTPRQKRLAGAATPHSMEVQDDPHPTHAV